MKSDKTTPNVPTLRFAEFTDEWEKYELSHFVTRITRRNKNNKSSLPLTISAQYGLVDQISFFNKTVASVDLSGYYLLYNGDFAYNKSYSNDYAWGAVKRLDKYEKGCLSSLYFVFRPNDNVDSDYLTHYFESSKWHKGISNIAGEGARNHGLLNMSVDDYFATKHCLPSLPEQKKIARFFNAITRRIEIQNKIIEDLKVLKKELCAKLFGSPLCGRIIAIEQVADIYGGYAFNSKAYVNKGKYKIVTIGNVTGDKYISGNYNTIDRLPNNIQKPQVLSKGDILVSLTGNVGRISIVDGDEYLLNQRVAKLGIEDDLTKEYIYQYLSNSSFEKDMINAGQGAAQKNIKNQDILSYCIRFPTDQTALENIDKLLSLYDIRITSEKAILSNLILQKSYYLRAMFI